jgi:hypothetical protein
MSFKIGSDSWSKIPSTRIVTEWLSANISFTRIRAILFNTTSSKMKYLGFSDTRSKEHA